MKGRHFCSPILVNHWQTSSVLSFPRDLACCRSMSWGEGAVTYLLLIPQSAIAEAECCSSLCNWTCCLLLCLPPQKDLDSAKNSKACVNKCGNIYVKLRVGLCANLALLKIGGEMLHHSYSCLFWCLSRYLSQIHPSSLIWFSPTSEIRNWCQGEIISVPVMLKSE